MNQSCALSHITKDYLERFHCILEEMIRGMTDVRLSGSISYNFIIQMIPHHQAAIEMSENLLKYTTDIPLQNIAESIISQQTKGIEEMKKICCACGQQMNSRQAVNLYQTRVSQITDTMFYDMSHACVDNDINISFMHEMIPHHLGAIRMSKNALQHHLCPGLVPILQTIITSQEEGVKEMRKLLEGC